MAYKAEQIFESEKNVKFIFQKSYKKNKNLIVVFSAFPTKGKGPTYNYVKTLEGIDCNKLFILDDFGGRASYYLCENKDFSIERSVISLINKIKYENNIENIISCGSSKGGYSAIYYGIKYGFSNIIVASPQYLLGDYLLSQTNCEDVVNFMCGSTERFDHSYLNGIMLNMITKTKNKPNVFIHLGKGEDHYEQHVLPMLSALRGSNIDYDLDLGDYSEHNDVAKYYPHLLRSKLRAILGFPLLEVIQSLEGEVDTPVSINLKAETDSEENQIAWYIYKDGSKIDEIKYNQGKTLTSFLEEKGKYQFKAFALNKDKKKVSVVSNPIILK